MFENKNIRKYIYKLPSEHVGPEYDVIEQSHIWEFHCCTHTPLLSQVLWLQRLPEPDYTNAIMEKRDVINSSINLIEFL